MPDGDGLGKMIVVFGLILVGVGLLARSSSASS